MSNRVSIAIAALVLVRAVSGQNATLNSVAPNYDPPTGSDRWQWFAVSTAGPASLAGGVISAAWGTLFNSPPEYGPHWDGFGKRYGMRLTGVSTGNAIEAGMGALWGEDPRYQRAAGRPFRDRVVHIVKMTFVARNRQGGNMPAYARYMGAAGNNFLSNSWRPDSEATAGDAALRTGLGFLGRMSSNAFMEFWPEVKFRLSRKNRGSNP